MSGRGRTIRKATLPTGIHTSPANNRPWSERKIHFRVTSNIRFDALEADVGPLDEIERLGCTAHGRRMSTPDSPGRGEGLGATPHPGSYENQFSMTELATEGGNRHRHIIGRARELDVFRAAFDQMLAGGRQVVLISGEPGIGKTRCAEALADVAEDQGALVLWGRCHEEAGAPPYWPWVQILRAYVDASSLDEVRLNMGTAANHIAALVPELLDSSQPIAAA